MSVTYLQKNSVLSIYIINIQNYLAISLLFFYDYSHENNYLNHVGNLGPLTFLRVPGPLNSLAVAIRVHACYNMNDKTGISLYRKKNSWKSNILHK